MLTPAPIRDNCFQNRSGAMSGIAQSGSALRFPRTQAELGRNAITGGNGTLGGTIGFSLLPLTVARQTGTTKVFGTVSYLG